MPRQPFETLKNLSVGMAAVGVAFFARVGLGLLLGGKGAFVTFYPATMVATLYGGRTGGLLATVISAALAHGTLPTLQNRTLPGQWDEFFLTLAFVVVNLLLVWLTDGLVKARGEARDSLAARVKADSHVVQILDSITDAFATFDRTWRIVYVNDATLKIYGAAREEFLNRSLWEHFPHLKDTEFEFHARRAMQTGIPDRFEYFSKRLGRWFDYRMYPSADGLSLYAADIHERKCIAEQREVLLDAERAARNELERTSRLKDEFLATLSHELRTPLNAILGWATYINNCSSLAEDEVGEAIATIERNARLQAQLIQDLLEMNAILSGKIRLEIEDLDLRLVIESAIETVRPMADAKQILLQKQVDTRAELVRGDATRLQQVVWNLLCNAIKFTPSGGTVQISAGPVGDQVEISVSDTGQGIAPDFLPFVFDRFRQADASTTRKAGGLGLGLSIVKHLVELHSGSIKAESAGLNQGAKFTVRLPILAGQPMRSSDDSNRYANPAAELLHVDLADIKLLVVDDEPDALRLVKRLLEERKATVEIANSAAEAFARLNESHPDVLISDIGMPGEDGYALIRKVRAARDPAVANIPAVAMTAFASLEDQQRAQAAGFQVHVSKPIDAGELMTVVAGLTSRARL